MALAPRRKIGVAIGEVREARGQSVLVKPTYIERVPGEVRTEQQDLLKRGARHWRMDTLTEIST